MHCQIKVPGTKPAGILEVFSPYNNQLVGTIETINGKGAKQAIDTMDRLFRNRQKGLPAYERIAILERVAALMAEGSDQLVSTAIAEGGKPYLDTKIELLRAIDGIKICIECIRSNRGSEIPMQLNPASIQRLAFTHREPIGPVVAVSAFNHPLNLIVHQIGPAIATGCPVVIKPARETPLSAYKIVEIFHQAGLPEDWCQIVIEEKTEVAEQLVTDKRVAFFSFIGSAKVGWMLRSKLAPGTRCALEHGGAAPVIVCEDAELDQVLPLLTKGGFYHAGQVCVSVQRVFIHKSIAAQVAKIMGDLATKLVVGDPARKTTDVGPLIRHREVDRISTWVNDAIQEKAQLITGGNKLSESLFQPTILFNPASDSKVSQQEIFGPVICLYSYDKLDDAINQANALPYSFQASIMTKNIDSALYAFKHLSASAVMINDHTAFRVDWMPFAGFRESGYGTGGIPYTFADMQIEKMAVIHSPVL